MFWGVTSSIEVFSQSDSRGRGLRLSVESCPVIKEEYCSGELCSRKHMDWTGEKLTMKGQSNSNLLSVVIIYLPWTSNSLSVSIKQSCVVYMQRKCEIHDSQVTSLRGTTDCGTCCNSYLASKRQPLLHQLRSYWLLCTRNLKVKKVTRKDMVDSIRRHRQRLISGRGWQLNWKFCLQFIILVY